MQVETIVTAFITSVLASVVIHIFSPLVGWEIKKRELLRENRLQRITNLKELVSELPTLSTGEIDRHALSKHAGFITLRGRLPEPIVTNIEEALKPHQPPQVFAPGETVTLRINEGGGIYREEEPDYLPDKIIRAHLLQAIGQLEEQWGLI